MSHQTLSKTIFVLKIQGSIFFKKAKKVINICHDARIGPIINLTIFTYEIQGKWFFGGHNQGRIHVQHRCEQRRSCAFCTQYKMNGYGI